MTRMIATLTVLSFVLGTAAYADSSVPASTSAMPGKRGHIAASNPNLPGATGRTVIRGNTSTISGDAKATRQQQTSTVSGD